ncbi:hypothetical protein K435DRAFT_785256 [Dendrothele bispora CBS 962.96]|uniref:Uncharacterized protein n=1 Tax=Dendrothele bispora (strain CBS 962.96) TaxID=1314807 RepID=A0A4S8KY04_DENBC|nr:hypothetical protein K435DRAFT_785256 [Dendrothele bispora CBS 962.96]
MLDHLTASWEAMQGSSVFYRRQQLFTLDSKLPNFGEYIIAGCRYGGPIGMTFFYASASTVCWDGIPDIGLLVAMMRDSTKIIALNRATPLFAKSQIQVFSSAGEELLLFSVDMLLHICQVALTNIFLSSVVCIS